MKNLSIFRKMLCYPFVMLSSQLMIIIFTLLLAYFTPLFYVKSNKDKKKKKLGLVAISEMNDISTVRILLRYILLGLTQNYEGEKYGKTILAFLVGRNFLELGTSHEDMNLLSRMIKYISS